MTSLMKISAMHSAEWKVRGGTILPAELLFSFLSGGIHLSGISRSPGAKFDRDFLNAKKESSMNGISTLALFELWKKRRGE